VLTVWQINATAIRSVELRLDNARVNFYNSILIVIIVVVIVAAVVVVVVVCCRIVGRA
jgi:hypothetical protein